MEVIFLLLFIGPQNEASTCSPIITCNREIYSPSLLAIPCHEIPFHKAFDKQKKHVRVQIDFSLYSLGNHRKEP